MHQQLYLRVGGRIPLPAELEWAEPYCLSFERSGCEVQAEASFGVTRELKPAGYNAKGIWHKAKMDVALLGATTAFLFDWKNGNPAYQNDFQLSTYAMDIMVHYPAVETVSVANIYLKTRKLGTPRTYTRAKDFSSIAADAFSRVGNIERARAAGSWPAQQGPLCGWCDDTTMPL